MKMLLHLFKSKFGHNVSWIVIGRVYQMVVNLVISMITARYLGPSNYGLINYVASFTALMTAFCTLGTNDTIVNEFISDKKNQGKILGSTIFFRVCSGILSVITIVLVVLLLNPNDSLTVWVAFVYSTTLIFQSFESINYWYQFNLRSKVTTKVYMVGYTVVAIYKVLLLVFQKSVVWFAASNAIDYIVVAILLCIAYHNHNGSLYPMAVSKKIGFDIIKRSHHYIISGTMVALYGQMDRIMIAGFMSEKEVGYYTASINTCTIWAFVLNAVIDSARSVIMPLYETDKKLYEKRLTQLYSAIIYLSFFVAILMTVFAELIIQILYGNEYLPASGSLRIATWSTAFSYLGVARSIWLVQHNQQKYEKYIAIIGACSNLCLNCVMIPVWGILGAAIATLVTQIITNLVSGLFFKEIRRNNILILKAFNIFKSIKDF
ncbi:MAG: flippase [Ruminococcus sp.]|nr:flippase [Ruminococcus sp.]